MRLTPIKIALIFIAVIFCSGATSCGNPDLVVTQINLSPSSPRAGDPVTFSATVKNQGTAATPAGTIVGVLFSVDGSPVAWSDTFSQSVEAGATVNLTANGGPSGATWTATSGSHQVVAFVDDVNRIANESNENNNQLARSVSVGTTVCTPACSGKVCGPNGCGGSCGSCPSGQACNTSGQCSVVSSTLPPLWNASPPAGTSPAPSGPVAGRAGEFDTGTLATNEVWDNFNGTSGSNPDSRLWIEDTINQGGTQVYNPSHSFLDGSGNAVLEATQSGSTITSGRFTSRTKFNMQYGWCAARIKFPKAGRSWFPAWWLLHVGYNYNPYGEIDVIEFFGNTTQYSTHVYFGDGLPSLEANKAVPTSHSGGNAGDGFHTYWMQWEPDRIRIGVDDLMTANWTPASVPAGAWDHMRQPFYFIANFAVAPSWLPAPLPTDFPARMVIDWVWYKPL
ncbi:MAG TPA: family 16 glycosylhydrolase [Polyangiaceae bacterium]|nr:family 16 glycosylhydrolase [Polyangiaceae bacterium]